MEQAFATGGRAPRSRGWLEATYRLPNELVSLSEAWRQRHWDVPHLADLDLVREERAVLRRLDYDLDPVAVDWLRGRVAAVRAERDRRRRGNG